MLWSFLWSFLQFDFHAAPEGRYPQGIRSVFEEILTKEGILALYKGATPVMIRAFPANAVRLLSLNNSKSSFYACTSWC